MSRGDGWITRGVGGLVAQLGLAAVGWACRRNPAVARRVHEMMAGCMRWDSRFADDYADRVMLGVFGVRNMPLIRTAIVREEPRRGWMDGRPGSWL